MPRPTISENDTSWFDQGEDLLDYLEDATVVEVARAVAREAELEAAIAVGLIGPPGPPGPDGADGGDGDQGLAGIDGVDGTDGADGADGAAGAQGPAGASIVWQGAWANLTAYALNDAVANNNESFVCIDAHTSSTAGAGGDEPGVGASWETKWSLMTTTVPGDDGADGADGTDGSTILNGDGAPDGGDGVDGDFYYDTGSTTFYGPKAAGTWPAGVPLLATTELSPWVISGNLPTSETVTGDSATGVWTVVGDLGATVTLEG